MKDESIIKKVGTLPGKTVAIFAGVHGNEKVGVLAIERLKNELTVKSGIVYLVYANPPAIEADKRFLQKNMNRLFSQDPSKGAGDTYEDARAKELMGLLDVCDAVLDVHSYNSETGDQFSFCEPNGFDLIKKMDFPIVVSRNKPDPKLYSTTVMGYMNKKGIGICIECGTSNRAQDFVDLAVKSCYQFLQYFGNIDMKVPYDDVRQRFIKNDRMIYKKSDAFRFVKDFKDFEPLAANEPFAYDGGEPLIAGENECIFFPRPNVPIGGEVCLIGILDS